MHLLNILLIQALVYNRNIDIFTLIHYNCEIECINVLYIDTHVKKGCFKLTKHLIAILSDNIFVYFEMIYSIFNFSLSKDTWLQHVSVITFIKNLLAVHFIFIFLFTRLAKCTDVKLWYI